MVSSCRGCLQAWLTQVATPDPTGPGVPCKRCLQPAILNEGMQSVLSQLCQQCAINGLKSLRMLAMRKRALWRVYIMVSFLYGEL